MAASLRKPALSSCSSSAAETDDEGVRGTCEDASMCKRCVRGAGFGAASRAAGAPGRRAGSERRARTPAGAGQLVRPLEAHTAGAPWCDSWLSRVGRVPGTGPACTVSGVRRGAGRAPAELRSGRRDSREAHTWVRGRAGSPFFVGYVPWGRGFVTIPTVHPKLRLVGEMTCPGPHDVYVQSWHFPALLPVCDLQEATL